MMIQQITTAFSLIGRTFRLWWEDWGNNILVSLIFVLVSLTGILVGPALLGVAFVVKDYLQGQRSGIAGWHQGFKRYFGVGVLWSLVNILILLVIVFNVWFYSQTRTVWAPVVVVLFLVFLLFWLLLQLYTPGILISQNKLSLWQAWKVVLRVWLAAPLQMLILGLFMMLFGFLSLAIFLPLLLGAAPLLCLLSFLAVQKHVDHQSAV